MSERRDRSAGRPWLAAYALMLGALAAVVGLRVVTGSPMGTFTRDVFSTAEIPVWTGILSNLGVFLWISALAVSAFTVVVTPPSAGWRNVLIAAAAVSGTLAVDDFFMIHEWILPEYLGVDERVPLLLYALAAGGLVLAVRGRDPDGRVDRVLWAAIGLLGLSVALDLVEPADAPEWRYLVEEGFKFLGIGTWLGFVATMASQAVGVNDSGGTGAGAPVDPASASTPAP